MLDTFYDWLDRLGYLHPIHPAMTHMPIGLVVGAFFLGWIGLAAQRPKLMAASYPVLIIAFVFWFPTVLFGYLDWQRYYAGAMLQPIVIKMVLAGVLFVLLGTGVFLVARGDPEPNFMVLIYTLCLATVTALGYYGGQLVYTGATPSGPVAYRSGEKIFDANCSGCHAHGGNSITPNLPLRSAPQLTDPAQFIAFLRTPKAPDGRPGIMPAFPTERLDDRDAKALYDYIVHAIAAPERSQGH